jgi:hypothetical protein
MTADVFDVFYNVDSYLLAVGSRRVEDVMYDADKDAEGMGIPDFERFLTRSCGVGYNTR